MWTAEDDRQVIDETFSGDAARYLADLHESRKKAIKWDSLLASARILPELKIGAQELIRQLLGYLPPNLLTMPEEPFIRALIHNYRNGSLTVDELFSQSEEHIKPIRNLELLNHSRLTYDRELYEQYFAIPPELRDKVIIRLTKFLGYKPALEHALAAEVKLQECLNSDTHYFTKSLSPADFQAIAVIKYREILLSKGKAAADSSPLVAMDLTAAFRLQMPK